MFPELINTSMHEGLPVSFQEALRCETPLLSSVDPQRVVTAYGIHTGYWEGTDLESLPRFRAGLRALLDDESLRSRLGKKDEGGCKTLIVSKSSSPLSLICAQKRTSLTVSNSLEPLATRILEMPH